VAQKVLDACPDAEWRLLFALARYGGLRCPSEHLALRWSDVDWERGRMVVRSSKTEHHEGKGSRVVPIFPELRPYLEAVRREAKAGSDSVITRNRVLDVNLRQRLQRIIRQAGVQQWPKLWQNLRMSRATELAHEHPAHVAAAWMGHSTTVASKHYWRVIEEDSAQALEGGAGTLQNPVQHTLGQPGKAMHACTVPNEKTPEIPGSTDAYLCMPNGGVGDTGLEPVTSAM